MNTAEVLKVFENILEKEAGGVRMEQTLEELQVDSIVFIRLVVQCETTFHIQFEDEMLLLSRFDTVENFIAYVCGRIQMESTDE